MPHLRRIKMVYKKTLSIAERFSKIFNSAYGWNSGILTSPIVFKTFPVIVE